MVVERREAEFLLDVLEEAFDFWFVAPAKAAKQRAAGGIDGIVDATG